MLGFTIDSVLIINRLATNIFFSTIFIMLSVPVHSSLLQANHAFFILSLKKLANEREYEFRVFSVFRGSNLCVLCVLLDHRSPGEGGCG